MIKVVKEIKVVTYEYDTLENAKMHMDEMVKDDYTVVENKGLEITYSTRRL